MFRKEYLIYALLIAVSVILYALGYSKYAVVSIFFIGYFVVTSYYWQKPLYVLAQIGVVTLMFFLLTPKYTILGGAFLVWYVYCIVRDKLIRLYRKADIEAGRIYERKRNSLLNKLIGVDLFDTGSPGSYNKETKEVSDNES